MWTLPSAKPTGMAPVCMVDTVECRRMGGPIGPIAGLAIAGLTVTAMAQALWLVPTRMADVGWGPKLFMLWSDDPQKLWRLELLHWASCSANRTVLEVPSGMLPGILLLVVKTKRLLV